MRTSACGVGDGASWTGGWSEWGWFAGGSVNGSRYRVFERTSTYHAAQKLCLQLGGYLARIETIREQVFVEDFLRHTLHSLVQLDGQSAAAAAARRTHVTGLHFISHSHSTAVFLLSKLGVRLGDSSQLILGVQKMSILQKMCIIRARFGSNFMKCAVSAR